MRQHGQEKTPTKHMFYADMATHLTPVAKGEDIRRELHPVTPPKLRARFNNVFEGIGKHRFRQVNLDVDESVTPVVQSQRRIAFARRQKLDKVLHELETADVIEEVTGPTDWVSNLVLTPKADPAEIRMNIDMTSVNNAIKRTRHVIPTIEDLKYRLNGAKFFSKNRSATRIYAI